MLATGCATTSNLIGNTTGGTTVYDEITPIQHAYRTTSGGLLLCTSGTLARTSTKLPYTLRIMSKQLLLPASDCGCSGRLIELPRSIIVPGWPDPATISREQLTVIPVCAAERGRAIETLADTFRNQLRVSEGATDSIYNISGQGTENQLELVYVRRDQPAGDERRTAFTLRPLTVHPHLGKLIFLPFAVMTDTMVAGVSMLAGGGVAASRINEPFDLGMFKE